MKGNALQAAYAQHDHHITTRSTKWQLRIESNLALVDAPWAPVAAWAWLQDSPTAEAPEHSGAVGRPLAPSIELPCGPILL